MSGSSENNGGASSGAAAALSSAASDAAANNRCLDLALEGERRCRGGDARTGVVYLEAALTAGTDDLRTLSAIYSQLGNAYFYMGDYLKALEYHRHDVTLARTIGDRPGEAKASGNLGNTLKVLGKHDEAIVCCQRHLDISRELNDKVGESRALYNLGNVYHAKGKHIGRLSNYEAGEYPQEVRQCLLKAVEYYEQNLRIVQELNDRAAEGRSCGNLGNTYYLLGDFSQAVRYHLQRLNIAKQFGDKPAMRRAYSNLGNAHVFLGEFEQAVDCYKQALAIAIELGDAATEAQACYSLGNTATLLAEHEQAIDYHIRHLTIARQLSDRVGQARASWSLGNAFMSLGQHSKALYFVMLHLQLSAEIGDQNGESIAEQNLSDLQQILGNAASPNNLADPEPVEIDFKIINNRKEVRRNLSDKSDVSNQSRISQKSAADVSLSLAVDRRRNSALSVNHVQPQFSATPEDILDDDSFFEFLSRAQSKRMDDQRCDPKALAENKENRPRIRATDAPRERSPSLSQISTKSSSVFKKHNSYWSRSLRNLRRSTLKRYSRQFLRSRHEDDDEQVVMNSSVQANSDLNFVDDSQLPSSSSFSVNACRLSDDSLVREQGPDEFLDLVLGIQSRRMDDQRAVLPVLPGLQHPVQVLGPHLVHRQSAASAVSNGDAELQLDPNELANQLDNDFIEMLIRCQSTRIDEQRSELPQKTKPVAVTVPDDDFFQLLLKMQARRFEEQRANLVKVETTAREENGANLLPPSATNSSGNGEKVKKR